MSDGLKTREPTGPRELKDAENRITNKRTRMEKEFKNKVRR